MNSVAWKMLTGNRGKYIAIVFGVFFAALLIAHQASVFCGLMLLTTSQIQDIAGADIWVMDENVQFIDDIKPLSDNALYRVRGVEGVDWAVRLYKGLSRARLQNGNYQQVILIGLDDATLIGAPQEILVGKLSDLRRPHAIMIDEAGFKQLWPNEPLAAGKFFEMNDHLAEIVGVVKARRTFQTFPVIYTRYNEAMQFAPHERKIMSFILANGKPGLDQHEVCDRIERQTGLQALTRTDFMWKTIDYFLKKTGIPINFFMTVLLGFIVGTAIAGQTFYLFTIENIKQFGALKAMGASNWSLLRMIMLQAAIVGFIGYALGVGGAAYFGYVTQEHPKLAFFMPWEVLIGTGVAVLFITCLASLFSMWRVVALEPAIVFKG